MPRGRIIIVSAVVSVITTLYGYAAYSHFNGPPLVFNGTQSAPRGFYYRDLTSTLSRGTLVAFAGPRLVESRLQGRIPTRNTPYLLKRIGAISGDIICARGSRFQVNGRHPLRIPRLSRRGTRFPRLFHGCTTVKEHQWLPLGVHLRTSFDGRYYGPLNRALIVGAYKPLLTF